MNIDWKSLWDSLNPIITFLGSGLISILITNVLHEKTQIRAIKESGLYTKRANVLDELIKKMEDLNTSANSLISPFPIVENENTKQDKSFKLMQVLHNFSNYYRQNKHYLSKNISKEIDKLINKYFDIHLDFLNEKPQDNEENKFDNWFEFNKKYFSDLNLKKEKIIGEFRKIIGVK